MTTLQTSIESATRNTNELAQSLREALAVVESIAEVMATATTQEEISRAAAAAQAVAYIVTNTASRAQRTAGSIHTANNC